MYHLQRNEMYRLGDNAQKSYVVHRRLTKNRPSISSPLAHRDARSMDWHKRRSLYVPIASERSFGTGNQAPVYQMHTNLSLVQETGLLRYGILLLLRRLPGEFKDCRGKVAVAAGILVEVVLVVLLGFEETAEGL